MALMKPLVMHILCDPHHHDHLAPLRVATFKLLIKAKQGALLDQVLEWTRLDSASQVAEHMEFVLDICDTLEEDGNDDALGAFPKSPSFGPFLVSLCITASKFGLAGK